MVFKSVVFCLLTLLVITRSAEYSSSDPESDDNRFDSESKKIAMIRTNQKKLSSYIAAHPIPVLERIKSGSRGEDDDVVNEAQPHSRSSSEGSNLRVVLSLASLSGLIVGSFTVYHMKSILHRQ